MNAVEAKEQLFRTLREKGIKEEELEGYWNMFMFQKGMKDAEKAGGKSSSDAADTITLPISCRTVKKSIRMLCMVILGMGLFFDGAAMGYAAHYIQMPESFASTTGWIILIYLASATLLMIFVGSGVKVQCIHEAQG